MFARKINAFAAGLTSGQWEVFRQILRPPDGAGAVDDVAGHGLGFSIGVMNPFYLTLGGESAYRIVGSGPTQVKWGTGVANDHRGGPPTVPWGGGVATDHRSGSH